MTTDQYGALIVHKQFLDAMFECIDKATPMPDPPRSVVNMMIDIWQSYNDKPLDSTCGPCVTEALKNVVRRFKVFESNSTLII